MMVPIITYICKLSISSGVFPNVFKKALVLPVYKGGHPDDINNYNLIYHVENVRAFESKPHKLPRIA